MKATRISDFFTGKNVSGYYKLYDKTQWYTQDQMQAFQLQKLKLLLIHCYDNVPYYSKLMKSIGIVPSDVVSFDILKQFPLLTKEIIQQNQNDLIPLNIKTIKRVKSSQTGGTTGNILIKMNDANTRSSAWATNKRFYDWMNVKDEDRKLILMGGHVLHHPKFDFKRWFANFLTHMDSFNPYDTSPENIDRIIAALSKNSYKLIRSYSQSLFQFAKILEEKGLTFNVNAITTTAEPLMEGQRLIFKKIFGADAFDQYGCGEIGGIAYECNHHKGLHVAEERVYLEINDSHDLIITDLDNFAMPYIRYWNADQALVSKELCSCGRKSMLLEKIMGRTCDYIYGKDGRSIHWAYFWHLIFESNVGTSRNLRKFQVRQISENQILFRIVANKLDPNEEQAIINNIKERLGDMEITIVYETDIENSPSGKYRPVVNEIIDSK